MNGNWKKTACAAMAVMLTAGALTACNGGGGTVSTDGEKPTLKFLMNNITEDPNTNPVAKMLEEKTGYKVEYDLLPQNDPEEKLNLIIASQTPYDGIQILGTLRAKFADYAKQGALTELDDLIEEYGQNMKDKFYDSTWEAMKVDGKVYGVVTANARKFEGDGELKVSGSATMLVVRTDLLEKIGISKTPETLDEFADMLREIKNADVDGNGMQNVPLTLTATAEIPGLYGAFGITHTWNEVDGKLVNRFVDPRYKDYLLYVKSLYDEGLLDKEFPTNKNNTVQEKFTSGRAAVMPMAYYDAVTILDALQKNVDGAEIEYILPIGDGNGQRGYSYGGGSVINRVAVIPLSAEHPEDMIKWMNAKLDTDVFRNIAIGEEGVHYEVRDGAYYPLSPKFYEERALSNDFMTGCDDANYMDYWLARVKKDERIYSAYERINLADDMLALGQLSPLYGAPIFDTQTNETSLNSLANDFSIKVITGAASIDSFDSFVEQWNNAGGAEYTEEVNEWYKNSR